MRNTTKMVIVAASTAIGLLFAAACGTDSNQEVESDSEDSYPVEQIELVVPFAPGGATDTTARLIADYVNDNRSVTVSVVNKEGAGGMSATNDVVNGKTDGSSIIMTAASNTLLNFAIEQDVPYDEDQINFISRVSLSPLGLIVGPDSPYDNAEELLDAVTEDPGSFSIGTSGLGAPSTIGIGEFFLENGVDTSKLKIVVLNSGAEAVTAVAGGQVDMAAQLLPEVQQMVLGDKVKGLAVSGDDRNDALPDIPSASEANIPAFSHQSVSGIAGPQGMDEQAVVFWEDVLNEATSDEEFAEKLLSIGSVPAFLDSEDYTQWNAEEIENAKGVATSLDIK